MSGMPKKSNKKLLRVCIVSPCPPPLGGMAIQATKLRGCIEKKSHTVAMVRTNTIFPKRVSWVVRLPVIRTLFNTFFFLRNLNKQLRRTDIVYFLTGFIDFFFWITIPGIVLVKIHNKKLVLNARGGGAGIFFRRWKYIVLPFIRMADKITTPSDFLKDVFQQFFAIEPEVVPNIADFDQFKYKKRVEFRPNFIVTRSLEEIYNVECVIKAFKQIHSSVPASRLYILGDGNLRKSLEEKVEDWGLSGAVSFHGVVPHNKIQHYYGKNDIFLNASNVDNLPGTILEAFACGLPVISTNAGGIPYMVDNNRTGLLVEKNDHNALAEKALYILENQDEALILVENARKECEKYSEEVVRKVMLRIFSDLKRSVGK